MVGGVERHRPGAQRGADRTKREREGQPKRKGGGGGGGRVKGDAG